MILLYGNEGMAGHMIQRYLSKKYDICAVGRKEINIETDKLITENFDYVINCVGVLYPDSTKDESRTVYINSYFPHLLSKMYKKVIHISTDCVFNGKKGNYIETDFPDETNIYGRSKALGELDNNKDLTLRVSIIGPEIKDPSKRSGLLNWITTSKDETLNGWTNALWNGITTLELAKCIDQYLQNPVINGIHHPVNESIDKYNLLCKINEVYKLEKIIVPIEGPKTVNKVLVDTKKFFKVSDYNTQLEELSDYEKFMHSM